MAVPTRRDRSGPHRVGHRQRGGLCPRRSAAPRAGARQGRALPRRPRPRPWLRRPPGADGGRLLARPVRGVLRRGPGRGRAPALPHWRPRPAPAGWGAGLPRPRRPPGEDRGSPHRARGGGGRALRRARRPGRCGPAPRRGSRASPRGVPRRRSCHEPPGAGLGPARRGRPAPGRVRARHGHLPTGVAGQPDRQGRPPGAPRAGSDARDPVGAAGNADAASDVRTVDRGDSVPRASVRTTTSSPSEATRSSRSGWSPRSGTLASPWASPTCSPSRPCAGLRRSSREAATEAPSATPCTLPTGARRSRCARRRRGPRSLPTRSWSTPTRSAGPSGRCCSTRCTPRATRCT